jgi:transcriptional regulator with XRE-family HTH domain
VDTRRVGRSVRALRLRADQRQADVAIEAGCSRQLVGAVEAGDLGSVTIGALDRIVAALGASLEVTVRWHGEGLDRLLDAAHAELVEGAVRRLRNAGWETAVEVSFNIRGERGSVDVMALHRSSATVLVGEVKSVVPDAGPMLFTLDRKARLAPDIARTLGWPCRAVGRVLVIGDTSTTRRRIAALGATFAAALPSRSVAVRRWLGDPAGPIAGLWFLPLRQPQWPWPSRDRAPACPQAWMTRANRLDATHNVR